MTATSRGGAGSGTAETTGNIFGTIEEVVNGANDLRDAVQEYLKDAETGIQKFNPAYVPGLGSKSFARSYAGYDIGIPDEIPPLEVRDAPDFDDTIGKVTFDPVTDPGDYTGYTYTPSFPPTPTVKDITDPKDWDDTVDVTVPTDLVLDDLADINLPEIIVPTIPQISVPNFAGAAPDFRNIRDISATEFNFLDIDYTSDVLTQSDSLIQQMIAGGVGIPETIWMQIWERAASQIDQATGAQIREIDEEWASRGFSLPQGVQASQVAETQQNAFNKKVELISDVAVKYSQAEIENYKFAVQQGIAFETLRGGWHQQQMQRAFEVGKYIVESDIAMLNADVALINAKAQVYNIEANVYKTLVESEIAKLEKYRIDIQAQELVLKDGDSKIKLYGAKIEALQLDIEEFNSRVKAAGVEAQMMQADVQVYSEQIKAFVAKIQAESTKIDLYKNVVSTEGVKMSAYETAVKVYTAEIQAYSAKIGASGTKAKAETEIEQLKLQTYDSAIKGYASEVGAKADAYKAEVAMFDSYVKGGIAQAGDEYNKTKTLLDSDRNVIAFDSELAKLQIADSQNATRAAEASAKILIDTNKSIAEINAGLAGSMYSAINLGSTESNSASTSHSAGFNTNYTGGDV